MSDAGELVALMKRYIEEEIPVPDPLLDRIAEIADDQPLMELVKDKSAPCEARMMGIELLRQMDSTAPMVDFLRWQVEPGGRGRYSGQRAGKPAPDGPAGGQARQDRLPCCG